MINSASNLYIDDNDAPIDSIDWGFSITKELGDTIKNYEGKDIPKFGHDLPQGVL